MAELPQADYTQLDDGALLAAMLAAGDDAEEAFVALYRRRQAGLYRFALRMTGSHAAAEDAVQETFLVLMRRAANYDGARGSVSAFLYGIARNCVLRGLERSGSLVAVGLGNGNDELETRIEQATAERGGSGRGTCDPIAANGGTGLHAGLSACLHSAAAQHPLDAMSRAQEVAALRRAILALPEHYREAVLLCDLEELSYEEAAAALDCAVGTVRSRLHRARSMLAGRLRALTAEDAEAAEVTAKRGAAATDASETSRIVRRELAADAGGGKAARPLGCEV